MPGARCQGTEERVSGSRFQGAAKRVAGFRFKKSRFQMSGAKCQGWRTVTSDERKAESTFDFRPLDFKN
jgi:hypothetical protein